MIYNFSIEQMKQCKYPNLMAELKESQYSICTVSEHLGYGRCEQDTPMIWKKLIGVEELYLDEVRALMGLFQADANYLFSKELSMRDGVTVAYIRHYEVNRQMEIDSEQFEFCCDLREKLKTRPHLMKIIKLILDIPDEKAGQVLQAIDESCMA